MSKPNAPIDGSGAPSQAPSDRRSGRSATDDRPPQQRGLRRGEAGKSAAAIARSRANLRRNAGEKHGGFVEAIMRPLTDEYEAKRLVEFPGAAAVPGGRAHIRGLARLEALADRYEAFIEAAPAGPMGPRVQGGQAIQPAALALERVQAAIDRALDRLRALEREHAGGAQAETLAQAEARLIEEADVVDDGAGEHP